MIIGLTGGIATGKSTVSKMFEEFGIPVVDADIISREVVMPGKVAYQEIVDHFGERVLLEDRTINRPELGNIIFSDEKERLVLNDIVHKEVRKELRAKAEALLEEGHTHVVMDIPLLIESELYYLVDTVVVVYIPEGEQLERLMRRNDFTEDEATSRIRSQLSIESKREKANVVIDNSATLAETKEQVRQFLASLEASK
ncbi:dephospho-CoA kinase [Paenalkalicoccus suaedae]|uniref:Dephospho-CoA kinase n=1 Tax=Paenalkalicoccus suaedae TaxID=2592382 RepID=A0A859FH80_9BACI|nr:dephospho-CoA kinase [Paenalkalicoccus suaedae]QKS72024.1 dephospho-CoA kinase [Paenalkalicoccus suaedae]